MGLTEKEVGFIQANPSAAMITMGGDGFAKAARVGLAVVDGKLWSSGTRDRARTKRLRRDPRCTLFVFDGAYKYATLETTVTLLDGPDVPALSVKMFREMQHKPTGALSWFGGELEEPEMLKTMQDEGRLIYQFEVHRAYGMY